MSALENIRKGLSSSGSTLIVGILIVGLVATFGNFLGTDNAFSDQKVLEINGQDISIQEFSLEANRLNSIFSNQEISLEQDQVCLLYTSPSPRDISGSRMPSSA